MPSETYAAATHEAIRDLEDPEDWLLPYKPDYLENKVLSTTCQIRKIGQRWRCLAVLMAGFHIECRLHASLR
jgi:hypothetical protein